MTPGVESGTLTRRQSAVRDAILAGPRGKKSPFPLTAPDGSLVGPFDLMVRFPEWGAPLQALGAALRFASVLQDRERELIILTVAGSMNSAFEVHAHTAVARSVGFSDADIEAVLAGRFESADPVESAALALARALLAGERGEAGALDEPQLAEVVLLVGYYRLLSQLMDQFGIGVVEEAT